MAVQHCEFLFNFSKNISGKKIEKKIVLYFFSLNFKRKLNFFSKKEANFVTFCHNSAMCVLKNFQVSEY